MSALETEFLAAAGTLIEPEWPILAEEFITEAVLQGPLMAKWALKTAITASSAGPIKRPIHLAIPRNLAKGVLPPYSALMIGYIRAKGFNLKIKRGFWFVGNDGTHNWRGAQYNTSIDFLLQMNHFAVRVFCGPNLKFRYEATGKHRPIQAYPPGIARSAPDYSFQTLEEFEGKLVAELEQLPAPFPPLPLFSAE